MRSHCIFEASYPKTHMYTNGIAATCTLLRVTRSEAHHLQGVSSRLTSKLDSVRMKCMVYNQSVLTLIGIHYEAFTVNCLCLAGHKGAFKIDER